MVGISPRWEVTRDGYSLHLFDTGDVPRIITEEEAPAV
jgi:hypothetical protein